MSVPRSPFRIWTAVSLLTVVAFFNVVDRILPSVLIEPIKHDLHLSDTVIGLINGFGFLIIYAVVGIPVARLSDRGRYGLVIGICLAFWSVMTALGGLAQSGLQLAFARMGVALGEAGSSPAAHAYISRNFAPNRRGAPMALLTLAVPLASVGALMGGGVLGALLGWRVTFMIVGAFGLALAPIVLLVLGVRKTGGAAQPASRPAAIPHAPFRKVSLLLILAASACVGIGGYTLTAFGPAFLMRVHGFTLTEVGIQYGLSVGVIGILSLVLTALVADRLSDRDARWHLWFVALLIVLIVPFSTTGFFTTSRTLALACMAVANITATFYMAPVVVALHRLVPADFRATASAILLFATAIAGGAGPLVAGMISDALEPTMGPLALGRALLVVPAIHLLAGILYGCASLRYRAEVEPE